MLLQPRPLVPFAPKLPGGRVPMTDEQVLVNSIKAAAGSKLWSLQLADLPGSYGNGDTVATWSDQSGNGRNWTATGTPVLVTNAVNGRAVVRYVGNQSEGYTLPNMTALAPGGGEIMYAQRSLNDPGAVANRFSNLGGGTTSHYPFSDGSIYDNFGTNPRKTVGNPAASLTTFHIYNARSAPSLWEAEINKTAFTFSTATNTVSFIATPIIGNVAVFGTEGWSGDQGLVVIFSSVLTSGERETILNLIGDYYNVTF